MKYLFPSLALIFCLSSALCQVKFEKGYYISNDDQRIEGLIRNMLWDDSPVEFSFKVGNESEAKLIRISEAKEFAIDGSLKFVRASVEIDQSKDDPTNLSNSRNPIWKMDTVFLNVLISGKANLYSYKEGNLFRYFYKVEEKDITQLIYKRFIVQNGVIAENNSFQQQLFNDVKCPATTLKEVTRLTYKESSLIGYFVDYLACNGDVSQIGKAKKNRTRNITAIGGTQLASGSGSTNYSAVRLGVEFETMTNKRHNWSFFMDPTAYLLSNDPLLVLSFGARHYFYLNDQAKLFFNLSVIGPFLSLSNPNRFFGVTVLPMLGGGVAYNRVRIEARIPPFPGLEPFGSLMFGYRLSVKMKK